jgi:hypothetical protein
LLLTKGKFGPEAKVTEWKYKTCWTQLSSLVPSQQEQCKFKLNVMLLIFRTSSLHLLWGHFSSNQLLQLSWAQICSYRVSIDILIFNWSFCMAATEKEPIHRIIFIFSAILGKQTFFCSCQNVLFCSQKLIIFFLYLLHLYYFLKSYTDLGKVRPYSGMRLAPFLVPNIFYEHF